MLTVAVFNIDISEKPIFTTCMPLLSLRAQLQFRYIDYFFSYKRVFFSEINQSYQMSAIF